MDFQPPLSWAMWWWWWKQNSFMSGTEWDFIYGNRDVKIPLNLHLFWVLTKNGVCVWKDRKLTECSKLFKNMLFFLRKIKNFQSEFQIFWIFLLLVLVGRFEIWWSFPCNRRSCKDLFRFQSCIWWNEVSFSEFGYLETLRIHRIVFRKCATNF